MKKGCLIIFAIPLVIIGFILIFPEKPASEKKIKEILVEKFNQIKDSEELDKNIKLLRFLEKNKSLILDSVIRGSQNEIFLDLNDYSTRKPKLPIKLLNELSDINSNNRIIYQLKITRDKKFSLTNKITDRKNYLYIIHNLSIIDSSNSNPHKAEKHIKTMNVKDNFQYTLTIKDAFNDIDPNNFAPN